MDGPPLHGVLDYLHRTARLRQAGDAADAELLERYVARRDANAFEALVRRHGPMILGVCRRLLPNAQDAEDAFQATFLVLVRKAASVRPRDRLAGWLHGVARKAALKARATANRRRAREKQVQVLPEPATVAEGLWTDLAPLLDQEVSRLPAKYRLPVVLCDLEGKTRTEAARQLGWPEGTVAGRLSRARTLLARRMTRQGAPASAGVLAAVLSQHPACAPVPASLLLTTLKTAAGARAVAAGVAALTQGVLRAMLLTRLTIAAVIVSVASVLCGGAALAARTTLLSPSHDAPRGATTTDDGPAPDETVAASPPVTIKLLGKRGGKPPEQFYDLALEATNPHDHPVWLVMPYYGDESLPDKGVFKSDSDQPFSGLEYDGVPKEHKSKVVEVHFLGENAFRAFLLPAKAKIVFERFTVEAWADIGHIDFWEASSLQVNGRTPLEKWLPYATLSDRTAVIPAGADCRGLDCDPNRQALRTDYPKEAVKTVTALVEQKWSVPIPAVAPKDGR